MDFWTKDYLASTVELTASQRAGYALTLIVAWTQGASLPADPERIRKAIGFHQAEWRKIWPAIEDKWAISSDGTRRTNARQRREWEAAETRASSLSEAGRRGNAVRWRSPGVSSPSGLRKT